MFINSGHHEIRQNRLDVAVLYLVSSSSSSSWKKWDGVKCLHTSNYAREEYSIEHMQCALRNSNNNICNVVIQYSFILSARCSSCNSSPALKRGLTLPPCGHQGHKVPKLSSLSFSSTLQPNWACDGCKKHDEAIFASSSRAVVMTLLHNRKRNIPPWSWGDAISKVSFPCFSC